MTQAEKQQVADIPPQDEFAKKNEKAVTMALPDAPKPAGDDLPEEVKNQLIGYAEIELERQLFDCLATFGNRHVTVDKIVLSLWTRHKKVEPRNKLIRMLNCMAKTGLIVKEHSPRGYRISEDGHDKIDNVSDAAMLQKFKEANDGNTASEAEVAASLKSAK